MFLIRAAWDFLFGWAGVDMLIGFAAVAVAVFLPRQFDFITDLRKWAICVAVVAFTLMGAIAHGYKNGIDVTKAEWSRSLAKETRDGEKILDDALHDSGAIDPDRLRNDSWNRDNWKDGRRP